MWQLTIDSCILYLFQIISLHPTRLAHLFSWQLPSTTLLRREILEDYEISPGLVQSFEELGSLHMGPERPRKLLRLDSILHETCPWSELHVVHTHHLCAPRINLSKRRGKLWYSESWLYQAVRTLAAYRCWMGCICMIVISCFAIVLFDMLPATYWGNEVTHAHAMADYRSKSQWALQFAIHNCALWKKLRVVSSQIGSDWPHFSFLLWSAFLHSDCFFTFFALFFGLLRIPRSES